MVKKKVVLLGDNGVGKTSLIRRFVIEEFHDHYIETIGTKISRKDVDLEIDGTEYSLNLQIWDILGQKTYSSVQSRAFVGMDGALIVADVTRKETLDSINTYWLPTLTKVVLDAQLVFLGNKIDLTDDAQCTLDDINEISLKHAVPEVNNSFLTSAKTGENVEEAFNAVAKMMILSRKPADPTRQIFEELLAESVYMDTDRTTLLGVTDTIITEFTKLYGDEDKGMDVLREQFVKAGIEISNPTKTGMITAIEHLAEELLTITNEGVVNQHKEKWLRLIKDAKEDN